MALPVIPLDYRVPWSPVESSFITRIGWLPNISIGGTILIEMRDEKTGQIRQYAYYDVPRFIWHSFRSASSKGTYFNATIKGRYGEQRIG